MNRLRSEEDLVRDCKKGAPAAWEELIGRYGKSVYGTIYEVLRRYGSERRGDLADDVYQRVFTELWKEKRLGSLRETKFLKPFLVSAAVSRTVDALRASGRTARRFSDDEGAAEAAISNDAGPDETAGSAEVSRIVAAEIEALPGKEAYILRLSAQHGLTHAQIADLTDVPRDTVSTVVRRAKEKVRDALKQKGITGV